jgi:3-hydroxymyristoyl/3-hydroxydecanoyl-(acyl carrier protein) dehydratase
MRYYLIDKVTEIVPGEHAKGVKCVSLADEVLHDHFPDYPVMPGALIVEGAAQLAGFLLETSFNQAGRPLLRALMVQIRDAKFYEPVGPGSTLEFSVRLGSRLEAAAEVAGRGRCRRDARRARAAHLRDERDRLREGARATTLRLQAMDPRARDAAADPVVVTGAGHVLAAPCDSSAVPETAQEPQVHGRPGRAGRRRRGPGARERGH